LGQPVEWQYESTDLARLVRDCCRLMRSEASRRGCVIIDADVQDIPRVSVESNYIHIIVLNLLENALKYSYQRRSVEATLTESDGVITLTIANYGIGIPREDRERIFEPYYRSHVPDAKLPRRGSGIGLRMVRHGVVHVHGG